MAKGKNFGGFGGGMNMQAMMKQAQKMQENMQKMQAELEAKEYTAQAGGGVVSATVNGKHELVGIEIKPEAIDPDDVETLSDIIVAGVNEAIKRVEDTTNAEMEKITGAFGGLSGMPGLF